MLKEGPNWQQTSSRFKTGTGSRLWERLRETYWQASSLPWLWLWSGWRPRIPMLKLNYSARGSWGRGRLPRRWRCFRPRTRVWRARRRPRSGQRTWRQGRWRGRRLEKTTRMKLKRRRSKGVVLEGVCWCDSFYSSTGPVLWSQEDH